MICVVCPCRSTQVGLGNFFCPNAMHGKFGLLSLKKASSHSTALPRLFFLYTEFSCCHTTSCQAYSFMTDGYRTFNVCTNLGACHTHEGGSGTNKSAQELTWRDRKLLLTLPHQGIKPRAFRFEFQRSNH